MHTKRGLGHETMLFTGLYNAYMPISVNVVILVEHQASLSTSDGTESDVQPEDLHHRSIICTRTRITHTQFILSCVYKLLISDEGPQTDSIRLCKDKLHESSVGLSSITNPKPRGKPSQSLLKQTYVNPAKGRAA